MDLAEKDLALIIEKVLDDMNKKNYVKVESDGIFHNMNEAVDAAVEAKIKFKEYSLEQREKIIKKMREVTLENAMDLANHSVKETGMGRIDHKYLKIKLAVEKTPGTEVLKPQVFTGDKGITLIERGPFGVIGSITPSTNPVETIITNSIGMLAGGNTVVFSPHPGALECSKKIIRLLNKAIREAGGPENLITSVEKPSLESTNSMIYNEKIKMVVATGGPEIVKKVLSCGKKAIGAGAGNPPVVVDETADIKKAARHIISGCSFDNNVPCIAEKEVIAVEEIYEELIDEMKKNGNVYELNTDEINQILQLVLNYDTNTKKYSINKKFVGKDARYYLECIGVNAPVGIDALICRTENDHPFVQKELMMPILPIVKAKNVEKAIELAVLDEHGNRHSAMMHSKNVDNLTKMANLIDTTIFVKNAPSYAGIGFGGEGYTTFTIAGPTGEGITNSLSFTRERRCAMVESFRIV